MSNVRYRHIVADYERRFRHPVRLPHCRLWRMGYVDRQFEHLEHGRDMAQWHEGDKVWGDANDRGRPPSGPSFIGELTKTTAGEWLTKAIKFLAGSRAKFG